MTFTNKSTIPNRTGSKQIVRSAFIEGTSMASGEVDYKCTFCGNMETFTPDENGISCKGCGSRIFMKPRRSGHKTLDAV
jgi:DNA-directed RNA polymerase subunit RPC12/RpoP